MSAETPNPQPGDTVLVQYRARYESGPNGDDLHRVTAGANGGLEVPGDAIIEVLERADDPSKALRGEVREIDGMAAVCYGKDYWVYFSTMPGSVAGYGIYRDAQMVGTPVIGVVPGTPAADDPRVNPLIADDLERFDDGSDEYARAIAESQSSARLQVPNEPHGLGDKLRREVAALAAKGHRDDAVDLLVQHTFLNKGGALAYVEGMEEYQTYLNDHGHSTEVV